MHGKRPSGFFSKAEKIMIRDAIVRAEKNTSGEIRVHLVRRLPKGADPLAAGKGVFEKLGMTRTRLRNGIAFILFVADRRLVILGDRGIHEKVPGGFWEEIRDAVLEGFQREDYSGGLIQGILRCGEKLKVFFPVIPGDVNELPDEIGESSLDHIP